MYMCTHEYMNKHTHKNRDMYTYIVCVNMFILPYTCILVYTHTCTYIYIYIAFIMYICTHTCVCVYVDGLASALLSWSAAKSFRALACHNLLKGYLHDERRISQRVGVGLFHKWSGRPIRGSRGILFLGSYSVPLSFGTSQTIFSKKGGNLIKGPAL